MEYIIANRNLEFQTHHSVHIPDQIEQVRNQTGYVEANWNKTGHVGGRQGHFEPPVGLASGFRQLRKSEEGFANGRDTLFHGVDFVFQECKLFVNPLAEIAVVERGRDEERVAKDGEVKGVRSDGLIDEGGGEEERGSGGKHCWWDVPVGSEGGEENDCLAKISSTKSNFIYLRVVLSYKVWILKGVLFSLERSKPMCLKTLV
ncbi:hypothetical protein U1Q18_014362 [Sarracenia purpurea var. burkii]